jgi:hypothetical protein
VNAGENARRVAAYRKDERLEAALRGWNDALAERPRATPPPTFTAPILLVVGAPRSGTTLLMQHLSRALAVTTADNVVSRFWGAPALGVLVSRSLRAQVGGEFTPDATPTSDHGVTRGVFEPHEFGYFWQRFFDFSGGHALTEHTLITADWAGLRRELAEMQAAGEGLPLCLKGVAVSQVLGALAAHLPEACFVVTDRDPADVAHSMLRAREARYGDARTWWSVEPRGHEAMAALPPVPQVAAQLAGILRGVREGLSGVDPVRVLRVAYTDLCRTPDAVVDRVAALAGRFGAPVPRVDRHLPPQTPSTPDVSPELRAAVSRALNEAQ